MAKDFFITGTGTGVGKTVVTCSFIRQIKESGGEVMAIKPLISGWEDDFTTNDTIQILASLGIPASQENIENISPWRFIAPLAPSMAARKENMAINYSDIVKFCKNSVSSSSPKTMCFIEGVGGVMSPIAENKTCLDLMRDLDIPVIIVAGSYLGTISHTLTAVKVIESVGVKIQAIIVNESESSSDILLEDTIAELQKFTKTPIYPLRRVVGRCDFVWKHTDNIKFIK